MSQYIEWCLLGLQARNNELPFNNVEDNEFGYCNEYYVSNVADTFMEPDINDDVLITVHFKS